MDEKEVIVLLKKYKEGTLSKEEKAKLETWYISRTSKGNAELTREEADETLQSIREKLPLVYHEPKRIRPFARYAVAASILLATTVGGYFLLHNQEPETTHNKIYAHDVGPGSNGAILTLSSGAKVVLGQTAKGKFAQQGNTTLQKAGDSLVVYQDNKSAQNTPIVYNTLTTQRGNQFRVILPDGTMVFLNAASELRYPVAFTGSERKVELTGEAYFEVAKNKSMPFTVHTPKGDIQVLGTHFNINAYNNEPDMRATLLEGSVKVTATGESRMIVPGQQAVVTNHIKVAEVNVNEVTAWKNGLFRFNETPTGDVMRQLERWYDVQMNDGSMPVVHFNGGIPRNSNLSEVLHMLSVTGNIRFEINGQKVSITKANAN